MLSINILAIHFVLQQKVKEFKFFGMLLPNFTDLQ